MRPIRSCRLVAIKLKYWWLSLYWLVKYPWKWVSQGVNNHQYLVSRPPVCWFSPQLSPPFTHQIAGELTMTIFNSSTHPVPGLLYASTRSVSLSISCRAAELGRIFYQRNRMIYWVEKMKIYIYNIILYIILYYIILYYIILYYNIIHYIIIQYNIIYYLI